MVVAAGEDSAGGEPRPHEEHHWGQALQYLDRAVALKVGQKGTICYSFKPISSCCLSTFSTPLPPPATFPRPLYMYEYIYVYVTQYTPIYT